MELTKIFTDGDTQTVRLPQDCRFDSDEVFIGRIGNSVVLSPKSLSTSEMAMAKIQALIGENRGWASEEDMIKDMAEFRRERGENTSIQEIDAAEFLLSYPATAREILEGLATPWEDCIPVTENEWADMREGLKMFTDDFLADGIEDLPPQGRNF